MLVVLSFSSSDRTTFCFTYVKKCYVWHYLNKKRVYLDPQEYGNNTQGKLVPEGQPGETNNLEVSFPLSTLNCKYICII